MLVRYEPEPLRKAKPYRPGIAVLLAAVALALIVIRFDLWHWKTVEPLLFGFLPVGLWWQAMVSILAAFMMWLMVRLAWPEHLEQAERLSPAASPNENSNPDPEARP